DFYCQSTDSSGYIF
nr:immunoglobulin light chain junction region [Macaca mulatta]MOV72275.1 immunoglobulin light chain junction region [Macaca mulatta]